MDGGIRIPTIDEQTYFSRLIGDAKGEERARAVEDLLWSLVNSTEFSWNH